MLIHLVLIANWVYFRSHIADGQVLQRSSRNFIAVHKCSGELEMNLGKLQYWDSNIAVNIAGAIKLSSAKVSILFTWNKP